MALFYSVCLCALCIYQFIYLLTFIYRKLLNPILSLWK